MLSQPFWPLSLSLFLIGVEGQSVEICNTVDIRGEINREIAMRITSDLNSKDRFFTDLNGYQVGQQYIIYILFTEHHIHIKIYTVYMQVWIIKARQCPVLQFVVGQGLAGGFVDISLNQPIFPLTLYWSGQPCNYMELHLCVQ